MKHQEDTMKGYRDTDVYYQHWTPDGDPVAVLLVVHGIGEHCGRYMNIVNHFVPLGYGVYGFDHIGHGKSPGVRMYVDRFQDYIITLKMYFDKIRRWHPGLKIFMLGHSMGGLVASAYLLEYQNELAGAVISAPAVKIPDNISPATIFLGKVLSVLAPKTGLVGLDADGLSRDKAVVEAYVNDPLVYTGKTTARLAAELLKTMQIVAENASTITLPILILQGSEDQVVDPSGAHILFELASSEDKTLKIYEGYYHEVFNEIGRERVLADTQSWLALHL